MYADDIDDIATISLKEVRVATKGIRELLSDCDDVHGISDLASWSRGMLAGCCSRR